MSEKVLIRSYIPKDRESVEKIHFETGLIGKSMNSLLTRRDEWKKNISIYLEKEPKSAFVLEVDHKVVGYLLGCLDDKNLAEVSIYLKTVVTSLLKPKLPKKDRIFWKGLFKYMIKTGLGKFDDLKLKTPKNAGHMHIDLLKKYRGKGYGSKLLDVFLKYAKDNNVKTIHAGSFLTKLNPNRSFWLGNGFKEYSRVNSGFWSYVYPNQDIKLVCYVKRLK